MQNIFLERRKKLMDEMGNDSIAILSAAPEILRNGFDNIFDYRQDSDFYYLTGYTQCDAVMVIVPGRKEGEFVLFNRPRDLSKEVWTGPMIGQEGAITEFGADQAFSLDVLDEKIPELLANKDSIYCVLGRRAAFDEQMMQWLNIVRKQVRRGIDAPKMFRSLDALVHEMRLIKDETEIAAIRYACQTSAAAHSEAMKACRPGMREYEIEAVIDYYFCKNGCRFSAYGSIVGGGRNACVLHYHQNTDKLHDGDLLLIDAGAEYQNYASDITRTFPVNGRFSPVQKLIYEIVLTAQVAAIESIKPGNSWMHTHEVVLRKLIEGLVEVGILKGRVDLLLEQKAYMPFYWHNTGHWLGLDTHDAGSYKINQEWRTLQAGMVFTVEPGLYLSAQNPAVPPEFHNIGIRIEDDVLVTPTGVEVLTAGVPKRVEDIESLMAQ